MPASGHPQELAPASTVEPGELSNREIFGVNSGPIAPFPHIRVFYLTWVRQISPVINFAERDSCHLRASMPSEKCRRRI
jgi:hypothetical protein